MPSGDDVGELQHDPKNRGNVDFASVFCFVFRINVPDVSLEQFTRVLQMISMVLGHI